MCNCIPCYFVTSISVDSTTNIATFTVSATSIASGCFNLRFVMCGQVLGQCSTATINIVAGENKYPNVLRRDGNYALLGQCARQVNCCRILHCNMTSSPSGNVMILDRLPNCVASTVTGESPTVVTVS